MEHENCPEQNLTFIFWAELCTGDCSDPKTSVGSVDLKQQITLYQEKCRKQKEVSVQILCPVSKKIPLRCFLSSWDLKQQSSRKDPISENWLCSLFAYCEANVLVRVSLALDKVGSSGGTLTLLKFYKITLKQSLSGSRKWVGCSHTAVTGFTWDSLASCEKSQLNYLP